MRLFAAIQADPEPDDRAKLRAWWLGPGYVIYVDAQGRWVLYRLVDDATIRVMALGLDSPYVPVSSDPE